MSKKARLFLALVVVGLLALAVLVSPVVAGFRDEVQKEFTYTGSNRIIYGARMLDGLGEIDVYYHRTGVVTKTLKAGLFYWDVITGTTGTWIQSHGRTFAADSATHKLTLVARYPGTVPVSHYSTAWKIELVSGSDIDASVYITHVVVRDVYGDPSYEAGLLEALKARLAQSVSTDTLTSGNVWILDRTVTYGDVTTAITMAGGALVSIMALALGLIRRI